MRYRRIILKYLFALGVLACGLVAETAVVLLIQHRNEVDSGPVSRLPIAVAVKTNPTPSSPEELYLDLLKKTLTRAQTAGRFNRRTPQPKGKVARCFYSIVNRVLLAARLELVERVPSDPHGYLEGGGMHLEERQEDAETMVGTQQLDNIQFCITDVLKRKIPGDVIECGAWRGGATILMRGVLRVYGDTQKSVWVADSFEGLPEPRFRWDSHMERGDMAVSLEEVEENFARYGLLDDRVHFLKGFFNQTLPTAPIEPRGAAGRRGSL